MPHSSSFIAQDEMKRSIIESSQEENSDFTLDPKAVWGLYCMYAIVGLVYGFIQNNITVPICYYVFGPIDVDSPAWAAGRATLQQCNIASAIPTMPWNLKVFYGLFLDQFGFFGSRRKGWIIFGWTGALALLVAIGCVADSLANLPPLIHAHAGDENSTSWDPVLSPIEPGDKYSWAYHSWEHSPADTDKSSNFMLYEMLLLVQCFFYIFSDVAGDGMTIELSRFEPPEKRGYILTTGQMTRFASTILANLLSILCMNGPTYSAAKDAGSAFPFELSFMWMHFVLVIICIPFFMGMVFFLQDPPKDETHEHHSISQIASKLWDLMQTKVMLFLIVGMLGNMSIASLINPAQNVIQNIVSPSTLQNNVGSLFGNLTFLVGVSIFRTYLMDKNWRYTFCGTGLVMALNCVFQYIMIYNVGGVGQSGWFFVFGNNILMIVQGISQVLSSLAVVEIAPKGFEASVYEFLTTMHNAGITLNLNLMGMLQPILGVKAIVDNGYACSRDENCSQIDPNYDSLCADDRTTLMWATTFTVIVNMVGVVAVAMMIPATKAQCKEWLEAPGCWRSVWIGVLGSVIGWGCLFFSLTVSFLSVIPATNCLGIAGGDGCGDGGTTTTTTTVVGFHDKHFPSCWWPGQNETDFF